MRALNRRAVFRWAGVVALALALLPGLGHAEDLLMLQMVEEARKWESKGQDELAAEIWRKLLATRPQHPEALVRLGLIEVRAGHMAAARGFYARALRLQSPVPGLKKLARLVNPSAAGSAPGGALARSSALPAAKPPATMPVVVTDGTRAAPVTVSLLQPVRDTHDRSPWPVDDDEAPLAESEILKTFACRALPPVLSRP